MRLLIIDNYDSFTFNLKHICEAYVSDVNVLRNDSINISDINQYDKIIISPGPGLPKADSFCVKVIKEYGTKIPILGVCLGAQAIAVAFGYKLYNLKKIMHGKQSKISIVKDNSIIYNGLEHELIVGRYHSWAIKIKNDKNFLVTAVDSEGVVMSFNHSVYPITGIQYHPESILTTSGQMILKNWLEN